MHASPQTIGGPDELIPGDFAGSRYSASAHFRLPSADFWRHWQETLRIFWRLRLHENLYIYICMYIYIFIYHVYMYVEIENIDIYNLHMYI